MDIKSIILFVSSLAVITLSALVLIRSPKKAESWTFFIHSLSLALWASGIAVFLATTNDTIALYSVKTYYIAALGIAASIMLFATYFRGAKIAFYQTVLLILDILFALLILIYPGLILGTIVTSPQDNIVVLNGVIYTIFAMILLPNFIIAIHQFYISKQLYKDRKQQQARLLFYGYIIAASIGVLFNLILPWFGNYELIWIGPLSTIVFVVTVSYSIYRHKLFDLRTAIVRSFLYIISILVFSVIYVFAITLISNLFTNEYSDSTKQIINVVTALIIAYTAIPLKKEYDKITNSIFFRDAYNSQDFINNINAILVSTPDVQKLLSETAKLIDSNLKTSFCNFYIDESAAIDFHIAGTNPTLFAVANWEKVINLANNNNQKIIYLDELEADDPLSISMREADIELIIKMVSTKQEVGMLLIGPKRSGNSLSSQDLQVTEIIADEVAIAVQNSLRFEEIAKFNITLKQNIDTATKELQQTNEKLRSLDEAKDEFISMASHQLRTPLTSVKGYISMLLEGDAGDLNDTQKKFLDQAFISSQRMVYLIADLLNVSRLKTGKFVIEKTPTYLPDVVESEISQLYETAKARELNLEFKKPTDFITLDLDETKTRQVIMNFVDNAIYYTPRGGKITVALKQLKNSVEYTVTDTGIGVPKKEQHHLFTKFYRAGNAKKSRPDGTGLGLYMAKKVIIAQGGHIIFKTQEGKGSTFGFSFPIEPKENT